MQRILTILQNYLNYINVPNLRWTDIVEIMILTYLIYHILLWIKNTRAWSLLKGLLVVVVFVIVAAVFNRSTILWIVQHVTGLAITAVYQGSSGWASSSYSSTPDSMTCTNSSRTACTAAS